MPLFFKHPWLLIASLAGSLMLSVWMIFIDSVINNDGVHYLMTAEFLSRGDWQSAVQTFKWPAYPFLIYLAQVLPGVDFELAAHVVTTLGFTITVLCFVAICRQLFNTRAMPWIALVVVLCYPGINEFRAFIIRDSVFLALYMGSIWFLVHYTMAQRWWPLIGSAMLMALAALFRVEALVLLAMYPLLIIGRVASGHWRWLLVLLYLVIGVEFLSTFYGWWMYRPQGQLDPWALLQRPGDLAGQAWIQWREGFVDQVASHDSGNLLLALLVTVGSVIGMVLYASVETMTLPFTIILICALVQPRLLAPVPRPILRKLALVLIILVGVLLAFAATRFFVAPRYAMALCMTLLLLVPIVLHQLWFDLLPKLKPLPRQVIRVLLVMLLIINALEGLDRFTIKQYLKEAGTWLKHNTRPGDRVISNSTQFAYYADRHRETWVLVPDYDEFIEFLESGQWLYKDYVAVSLRRRDQELAQIVAQTLDQEPIREYINSKGDRLLIFYTADD